MGRELKRVPMNFDWPIGKVWSGYVNPHPRHDCSHCEGLGWSKEYRELQDEWYGWRHENYKPNPYREGCRYNSDAWSNNLTQEDVDSLIEANRLWDFTRVPLNDEHRAIVKKRRDEGHNSWLPFDNGYKPTAKEVNEWNLKGMGHDSLNCSIVIKARLKREGKSHLCPHCDGEGLNWQHPKAKELHEGWQKYDPPTGNGFQLWGTTNEGNPESPIFDTLDNLCEWCSENATTFAKFKASKAEWIEMLSDGIVYYKIGNNILM